MRGLGCLVVFFFVFFFPKYPPSAEVFLWVEIMNKVRDCTCGPSKASHKDAKGVAWGHWDVELPLPGLCT